MVEVLNWVLKSARVFSILESGICLPPWGRFRENVYFQGCLLLLVVLLKSGHGSPVMYDQDASTICSHLERPCSGGGGIAEGSEGCFPYTTAATAR